MFHNLSECTPPLRAASRVADESPFSQRYLARLTGWVTARSRPSSLGQGTPRSGRLRIGTVQVRRPDFSTMTSPPTRSTATCRRRVGGFPWARLRVTRGRSTKSGADGGDVAWGWGSPRAGRETRSRERHFFRVTEPEGPTGSAQPLASGSRVRGGIGGAKAVRYQEIGNTSYQHIGDSFRVRSSLEARCPGWRLMCVSNGCSSS